MNENAVTSSPRRKLVDLKVIDKAYLITRVFDAPRALVFKVWADPAHFAKWWGPHLFDNPVCEIDLQVGGKFQVVMRSPEGEKNALKGEYLEIVPDQKIVLQMYTGGHAKEWHAIVNAARGLAPDAAPVDPITTVIFEDAAGGTKLTIEQRFENNTDRDAFIQLGTAVGWSESFVKMDNLLATIATERDFIISRILNAPLDLVWKVWTDRTHIGKWWGPNGFDTTTESYDFKVGGEWVFVMHGPDGTDYPNWVRYDEIVPQEHIAYTHGSAPNDPDAFHGRVTFAKVAEKETFITLQLRVISHEDRNLKMQFGAFEGGDQTLGRLNAFLQANMS